MVAEALRLVDARLPCLCSKCWRRQLVVEPPADVLRPGLPAIRPPGVAIIGCGGIELAIDIAPAAFGKHLAEPGALFGQETGVFLVRFPVFQVEFLVGDIPVAADDDLAPAGGEFAEDRIKTRHEAELGVLTFR